MPGIDEQRRHLLDLTESNKRPANQRKAMLHILADYEQDRRRLARQTGRLDNSRRAVLHILQDSHKDKLRLEASRKAMIHIMGDLQETTAEMRGREHELCDFPSRRRHTRFDCDWSSDVCSSD